MAHALTPDEPVTAPLLKEAVNEVSTGIRVSEVAAWTFVPISAVSRGAGRQVNKVEPPSGDPAPGLVSSDLVPRAGGGNCMVTRFATTIGDVKSAGTTVVMLNGAANRDTRLHLVFTPLG